jgi:hypothetical protein
MIVDNFISPRNAEGMINLIDDIIYEREDCDCPNHEIQTIIKLSKTSERVWKETREKFLKSDLNIVKRGSKTYKLIGLSDSVTLSRHFEPIGIHRDVEGETTYQGRKRRDLVCLYKIAVYLNDVSRDGGTILYDDFENHVKTISPKKCRALIFDIRDLHSGAPIPDGETKYLIGFRLLYVEV